MSIEIDTSVWNRNLAAYSKTVGQGMRESLYQEWPLLMEKIIAFTPPKTLGQGRAATSGDLEKTMRPFNPAMLRSKGMKRIVDEMDVHAFNIVAQRVKSGPMKGAQAVTFSPEQHTSKRNARGKVGQNYNHVILGENNKMLTKYKTALLGRVGWAKAGWLKAYYAVGGNRVQSFVSRHGMGSGDVIDDHANEENPSITAINRTPWAARRDEGSRIIRDAINSRAEAIRSKIITALRLAKEQAGFSKAA